MISLYITENITKIYEGSEIDKNDELINDTDISAMIDNGGSGENSPIEEGIPSLRV